MLSVWLWSSESSISVLCWKQFRYPLQVSLPEMMITLKLTIHHTLIWPFCHCRAQFSENRSIFNTPNARLMNASLLKGEKYLRENYNFAQSFIKFLFRFVSYFEAGLKYFHFLEWENFNFLSFINVINFHYIINWKWPNQNQIQ